MARRYWLMKSEPNVFSIEDLARAPGQTTGWDGVRNYQARNLLRDEIKVGDGVLFYHSSCPEPGIAGLAEVASRAYPDTSQFDRKSDYYDPKSPKDEPRWVALDVKYKRKLKRSIPLEELKQHAAALGSFALLARGNRLSVLPVTQSQFDTILALERAI